MPVWQAVECLQLAQSGHRESAAGFPLSAVTRTPHLAGGTCGFPQIYADGDSIMPTWRKKPANREYSREVRRQHRRSTCAAGLDRRLQQRENADQLLSHVFDGRNDGHGNARGDESVFDRCRSGFISQETLQLLDHDVASKAKLRRNHVAEKAW